MKTQRHIHTHNQRPFVGQTKTQVRQLNEKQIYMSCNVLNAVTRAHVLKQFTITGAELNK